MYGSPDGSWMNPLGILLRVTALVVLEYDRVSGPCVDELDPGNQSFCDLNCVGVDLMKGDGAEWGSPLLPHPPLQPSMFSVKRRSAEPGAARARYGIRPFSSTTHLARKTVNVISSPGRLLHTSRTFSKLVSSSS